MGCLAGYALGSVCPLVPVRQQLWVVRLGTTWDVEWVVVLVVSVVGLKVWA